jgi:ornithine carbamoyltransferase
MDMPVHPLLLTPDSAPTPDGEAVLHMARSLRAMARSGATPTLLGSKHLGLLSRHRRSPSQGAVEDAARQLGARVAWVPPEAVQASEGPGARDTARLLGQLYDALDCEGLPDGLVQCLRRDSGVPVYEGLGRQDHPLARLLPRLDADAEAAQTAGVAASGEDGHRFLLQAMLVRTLL